MNKTARLTALFRLFSKMIIQHRMEELPSMEKRLWGWILLLVIPFLLLNSLPAPAQQVVEVHNPSGVRADGDYIDKLLHKAMEELGKTKPSVPVVFPEGRMEKILIRRDFFSEVNELFYQRGWTDGLPIVPPTVERVKEMMKGADLSTEFVVGVLDPMGGQATIEKIAVNAVMAGCRPEYMPVLVAGVEAIANPDFDLRGIATTTSPDTPMLIINGPIAMIWISIPVLTRLAAAGEPTPRSAGLCICSSRISEEVGPG
jgi:hypothetical protein